MNFFYLCSCESYVTKPVIMVLGRATTKKVCAEPLGSNPANGTLLSL